MIYLFNKPNWLRPEINTLEYWIHAVILGVVLSYILHGLFGLELVTEVFSFDMVKVVISVVIGDVIAHTVLGLD